MPTKLMAAQPEPYEASTLMLTAGRAAWTPNTAADPAMTDLWTASIAVSGGVITASSAPVVTGVKAGSRITISGRRFAVGESDGLRVYGGDGTFTYRTTSAAGPQISGSRILFSGKSTLLSLATGAPTDLTSLDMTDGGTGAALWGNYLTFRGNDGTLRRKDLTASSNPAQLATRLVAGARVYSSGDWVGWCNGLSCSARNARTLTAALSVPLTTGESVERLTSDGVLVRKPMLSGDTHRLLRYPSAGAWTSAQLPGVTGSSVSVDDSVVAWIGVDGRPRVAPAPQVVGLPRSLGNPIAKSSFASGGTWTFELPTSAPLTACAVRIKSGATVIRTLRCIPSLMTMGSAKVVWDGKNDAGAIQPAGTYTWVVNAANADGSLLAADGTPAVTSGTVNRI
jgi:hypothetical protein